MTGRFQLTQITANTHMLTMDRLYALYTCKAQEVHLPGQFALQTAVPCLVSMLLFVVAVSRG